MAASVTSGRVGTVLSGVVAVGLAAGVTVSSLAHHGSTASQVGLTAGTAWFADRSSGEVSLLDGATGTRVSEQKVAAPGDDITVVQSGSQSGAGAYIVDRTTGQATRVDGATLEPGHPVRLSSPGDPNVAVVSNAKATWAVVQGGSLAEQVDPNSLGTLGAPHSLSTTQSPIETPDGSLWTTGAGGFVYSFSGGVPRTRTHPVAGNFTLVQADDQPVLADPSTGKVYLLNPSNGAVARTVTFDAAGTSPIVAGSGRAPYLLSVNPSGGELQATDLNTHSTAVAVIGDPNTGGSGYGTPAISGDFVFVPNYSQQAVVVAKLQDGQLDVLGQVGVGDKNFQVFDYDGSVWFDDPTSALAGVITPTFDAIEIPKAGGDGAGHRVGHLSPIKLGNGHGSTSPTTLGSHGKGSSSATTVPNAPPVTTPISTPIAATPAATPAGGGGTGNSNQNPQPSFSYFPTTAVAGHPVTFTDTTQGPHTVFQWVFSSADPGTAGAVKSATVTWKDAGTYQVSLVVTQSGQSFPYQTTVKVVSPTPPTTTPTTRPGSGPTTSTTNPTTTTSSSTTTTTLAPSSLVGYQVVEKDDSLAPGQYLDDAADCPAGDVVLGGGAAVVGNGTANFDTVIEESDPGTLGGSTYLWDAGIKNNSSSTYTIGIFAACAQAPPGYQVVQATATVKANSVLSGAATCPSGTQLLGGGAAVFFDGNGDHDTVVQKSWPDTTGDWNSDIDNLSSSTYTIGFNAVCASPLAGYQIVTQADTLQSGSYIRDVAACPGSEVVAGGGEGYGGAQILGGGHGRVVTVTYTMMESEISTLNGGDVYLASVAGGGSGSDPLNIYAVCVNAG
ncbi:MAG TPA: PKD domain-containing protein [Acidimicrobiales bacterium]|jgi:plastocyanin|nr:PKD domain-containing protein [Acidimicrobiales bacterium]